MKLNKIFMALAAMAIVGCSSEDLNEFAPQQPVEDSRLVELNPNFVLAGVGAEGSVTRTHWELTGGKLVNKFLPIWGTTAPDGTNTIDAFAELEEQAVGLCWLGQGSVGTDVYTNYQFFHFGWLNNGAAKAEFECNTLKNGAFYDEITAKTGTASKEAVPGTDWTVAELPAQAIKAGKDNLNYNSGLYKTKNKAIFGGQYIVYYPFNEEFKNAGTIPAAAITTFNPVSEAYDAPEVGHATFRYSSPVTIEGGDQAADFGLYNLSALVQLRVAGPKGVTIGKNIDQIVLYSAKKQLLKQANLAADKIVAGKKGTDLYSATEGLKTISAIFGAPVAVQATDATSPAPTSAYITVLPTTVEDLVILVHSTDGKWATVKKPNTVFEAGTAKRIDIEVKAADFKADFIAVDESTLRKACNEANTAGGGTVTVIGDITLDPANSPYDFAFNGKDNKVTYKGDAIIVPEDVVVWSGSKFESNVRILGKSCCTGTLGGRVQVYDGSFSNVTMEPTEAKVTSKTDYDNYNPQVVYWGNATIAADKTFDVQAGNVVVNAAVQHKGDIKIAKDVTLTVTGAGDLNFMGATVVNDGTIEVQKAGKFDMTDKNGNATANDGKRMTNNGKFIHNVDAGVGTAVQKMTQNGEYRCRVDDQVKLDDAFLQWTAASVIEIVGAGTYNLGTGKGVSYKHNNEFIDFEVNAAVKFDNTVDGSKGDKENIQVRNLTVTTGSLDVDLKGTVAPNNLRTLTVWGDMVVKANTTFTNSQLLDLKENLTVENGSTLFYKGKKANVDGLKVAKDIKVSGATFDAGSLAADVDAINITCANFTLEKTATAIFGNRTDGGAKNMVVSGTITNPSGCTFTIVGANQDGNGSVLAWISCSSLIAQGTFPGSKPRVE